MTLIDLTYADPPAPADLAERARHQGGRIRRRRATRRTGGAALLIAALAIGTAQLLHAGPQNQLTSPGAASPTNTPLARTTAPKPTNGDVPRVPKGPVIDLGMPTSAGDLVAYATSSGYQCLADRVPNSLRPIECRPLLELDVDGLWGNAALAPDVDIVPSPQLHAGRPARWLVFGLARGRVDSVTISLPSGKVAASLAPLGDPAVGSFYWTVTDDFDELGSVIDPSLGATYPGKISDIPRIGYAGTRVVQSCVGNTCK